MSLLPPGCRFYPSDQELLRYYLTSKNHSNEDAVDGGNNLNGYGLIKELDLYEYEPSDLPENTCYSYGCGGRKRHWYCYTNFSALKEKRGGRSRRAKGGFWRRSGRVRDVVTPGKKGVLGTKSKFVFYLGNSVKNASRTGWILYEYALIDHVKASYVLCRIFVKSSGNSISENMMSSCAEESVSAVRHVGIQHDGFSTPEIAGAKVPKDNPVDRESHLSEYGEGPSAKVGNQVTTEPTSVAKIQFPSGIESSIEANKRVSAPGLPVSNILVDSETAQQLVSILEGDFIELDDFVD